jgi:hypothetical protein
MSRKSHLTARKGTIRLVSMDPIGQPPLPEWQNSVRNALARGDTQELRQLFEGAQEMWGKEQSSRLWLEIVSAFDANAVTG